MRLEARFLDRRGLRRSPADRDGLRRAGAADDASTAGRSSSSFCRRRFCCSRSSSFCRSRRPAGTASSTGTATGGRKNSSGSRTTAICSPTRPSSASLINNGLIIVVSLLVQLPLALGVAMMVAGRIAGAVWFRMIFFLPYVLADVAAGLIWHFMFDGDYGLAGAITDRARHAALFPARRQGLGRSPRC